MAQPAVLDENRFEELCNDLNMDMDARIEALKSYKRIMVNYTLEVGEIINTFYIQMYVYCIQNYIHYSI